MIEAQSAKISGNTVGACTRVQSQFDDDPKIWRQRAEEARTQAGQMMDPAARQMMLDVAKNYDEIATLAERRQARAEGRR